MIVAIIWLCLPGDQVNHRHPWLPGLGLQNLAQAVANRGDEGYNHHERSGIVEQGRREHRTRQDVGGILQLLGEMHLGNLVSISQHPSAWTQHDTAASAPIKEDDGPMSETKLCMSVSTHTGISKLHRWTDSQSVISPAILICKGQERLAGRSSRAHDLQKSGPIRQILFGSEETFCRRLGSSEVPTQRSRRTFPLQENCTRWRRCARRPSLPRHSENCCT